MLSREDPSRWAPEIVTLLASERVEHGATRARFLETHDTARVARVSPSLDRALFALVATVPGVPMIQAGQEIGATACYGMRAGVDWSRGDADLRAFYRTVLRVRNATDAVKYGDITDVRPLTLVEARCLFVVGEIDGSPSRVPQSRPASSSSPGRV